MNPVATSDAAFRGGACPTPEYTIAYTGNYTTSADANQDRSLTQALQLIQDSENLHREWIDVRTAEQYSATLAAG